ncbi:AMP-binding protein, partial [Wenjunlia tyrosinilytica]|uniref:AMP-binding protein n=1 Tax=Wenjunlia tyrosinilytica TaxID=1544741 RepID=UPI00166C2DF3
MSFPGPEGFNPADVSADAGVCLHGVFEERVGVAPDAVAVVDGDVRVTYGELNGWADRIAYRLRSVGVGAGVRVGVCAERGVGLVAAVLGVLKAGGAYVPLDPSYPAERVAFMLADCGPAVVLVEGAGPAALVGAVVGEGVVVWDLAVDFAGVPDGGVPDGGVPDG